MQETGAAIEAVKLALKARKITYSKLGQHLGLSEIGIKKMFQSGDMSLDRLLKICRLLEVRPESIFAASTNQPMHMVRLTQEQSDFFVSHPHYFCFFLKLVYEQTQPEQIAQEFGLSDSSLWKYLKKLDDLGLVKLKEGTRVDLNRPFPLAVDTKGRVEFENLRRKLATDFFNRVCKEATDRKQVKMSNFKLSEERSQQLAHDLEKLFFRYKKISEVEKVFGHESLCSITALAAIGNFSFISEIKNI
jgi:DNA-binding Xre family transcriptional regulator